MSSPFSNAALSASAGTGKTFALTNRYLALLAAGVEPTAIVALTFTRKAAGEILSRLLTRLANAAANESSLADLNRHLTEAGLPNFPSPTAARSALRRLVRQLPRLRIGTLDSFFFQILRQFRWELGLSCLPTVFTASDSAYADPVLQTLLSQTFLPHDEKPELLEAFKLATFGDERKRIYDSLAALVQDRCELFHRAPEAAMWGQPHIIWKDPQTRPATPPPPDWAHLLDILRRQTPKFTHQRCRSGWETFCSDLESIQAGGDFPFNTLGERLYQNFVLPEKDQQEVDYCGQMLPLDPEARRALTEIMAYVRWFHLSRHLLRTRGMYRLLAAYARERRRQILHSGQLRFADIAPLLSSPSGLTPSALRRQLDARLDARFHHWLLDEFQDTSLLQWLVLENLLDEVLQSPEGDRTLFYVGDTKQAIYEWRSGDPRLFRRILEKYNRSGPSPAIHILPPLVQSWRSSPVILETANLLFGQMPLLLLNAEKDLSPETAKELASRWHNEWTRHQAAPSVQSLSGYAALYIQPRGSKEEPAESTFDRTARLIQELRQNIPAWDSYSVAILTRTNHDGRDMLSALARTGISAAWTGKAPLLDNVLLPAILALAKWIEHPGDTLAKHHVAMSPLAGAVGLSPADLAYWNRVIRAQGYAGFCAQIAARLSLANAPLEEARLRTLISLAAEFDRRPDPSALRFCAFVEAQEIPAESPSCNLQILTMHKAKGLEFDIVFLPAIGTDGITSYAKQSLLMQEADTDQPAPPLEWILSAPEQAIIQNDPALAIPFEENRCRKALEELRLLYVAMTRAKRALFLIIPAPPGKKTTVSLATLVQWGLCPKFDSRNDEPDAPVWTHGDPLWWRQSLPSKPIPPPAAPLTWHDLPAEPAPPPLKSHIASREAAPPAIGQFLRPENAAARELGTRVHALFEQIEWLAPGEVPDFSATDPEAAEIVARFLRSPGHHRWFERPNPMVELFREQPFEVIFPEGWLSGVMDRLHLWKDANGKPCRAQIVDYKTDREANPDRHRPQMEDYRRAAAKLFQLPPEKIECLLLFVRADTCLQF